MAQTELELKMKYDPEGDVLYGSLGEPRAAISVETEKGIVYRLDPDTDEVVGFTVIDFSKRFLEHPNDFVTFPLRHSFAMAEPR
jgi:hypothetical protein